MGMIEGFSENKMDLVDAWTSKKGNNSHIPTCGVFDFKQWEIGPHCRDYFFVSQSLKKKINQISVNTETNVSDHQHIRLVIDI